MDKAKVQNSEPGADENPGSEHEPAVVNKPADLERCVEAVMDHGYAEDNAYAICNAVFAAMQPVLPGKAITGISNVTERKEKFFVAEAKALKNGNVEHYITTETPDRVGDIIKAKGWDINGFRKTGGPVMFGHYPAITPGGDIAQIGNAVEMEVQRKGIWSVTKFHEKTALSRDAAVLARDGIMKSWSVGFNPLEPPENRTDKDGKFLGYIFNKQELLEYSLVPIPANPDAVSKAMSLCEKGIISRETAAIFAGPSPLADQDSAQVIAKAFQAAVGQKFNDLQTDLIALEFSRRSKLRF